MDWPAKSAVPPMVSSYGRFGPGLTTTTWVNLGVGSITWPAANRIIYVPMVLPYYYPLRRAVWGLGSTITSSSIFGVYSSTGTRIFATASTLQSGGGGANSLQFVTASPEVLLSPGHYYFAFATDGTTNRARGTVTPTVSQAREMGLLQESPASLQMPATMTAATIAAFAYPLCGISAAPSGF